ncbi:phage tail family protein [Veillonella tobetsuensis]|uniref:hypothetical protein n=1 Tax=Veillonella tobetsuensis TaxID=1110546 RepID=UPI000751A4D3|nr:hypothetical protein [Veillonella tobetsuensis]
MTTQFVSEIDSNLIVNDKKETKKSIFEEYERVIIDSLLQTFGLDFIILDQYGGDVDTIHNLEKVGDNSRMSIKNSETRHKYETRGEYDSHKYHSDKQYITRNREFSKQRKSGGIKDAYTKETLHKSHDLDHIISAKSMHDNAAVYATSLDPVTLVNSDDNLVPTISSVNRSKGAKSVSQFLSDWESTREMRQTKIKELRNKTILTDKERKQLKKYEELEKLKPEEVKKLYNKSKQSMDNKLNKDYYTSSKFAKDTTKAALKLGGKMAVKQVIGFVLVEVWFSVKERISFCLGDSLKSFFSEILEGIKEGFTKAKSKYKEIISKIKEGLLSGIIASLMTTLTNTVKTLLESSVKILRHASSAIVQSIKVLFFDKHNSWQEKIHAVLVLLATSASTIIGSLIGGYLAPTLSNIPIVGDLLVTFIEIFISGMLSCTLIYFIDKWNIAKKIVDFIQSLDVNPFGEYVESMKQRVAAYEAYVAKLLEVDVDSVVRETKRYAQVVSILQSGNDDAVTNYELKTLFKDLEITLPWKGDFSSFMSDKNSQLVFE